MQLYQFSDEIAAHYNNTGVKCLRDGDLSQALMNFDEALRFKPDDELILQNRRVVVIAIAQLQL